MSKKNKSASNYIYSTDPHFLFKEEVEALATLAPVEQRLKVLLETKHRAGKMVTVIMGFIGRADDLEALGKKLRTHCGTGGSVKEGEIILQGDQRERVVAWLKQHSYSLK